ncbi:pyridoxamine 5'-phosphate oxidase [Nonomuraea basaltis]|uniref:pyridoxamine 5'-phosphate oxidase n=1 Tax=Nonomuraea basaltis TaxID=2495887 RepID=UPI00110C6760|nr:pyridoxamine 5'-phosphate oxidase [Nonomuraea basaltis]TMR96832.1 pyridoxamine 5'-phosphate oxidase [Nonomuraea basaltis]
MKLIYPPPIQRELAAHTTLTLAYADEHPQACAVFYALAPDGSLAFLSSRSTAHGRALATAPPEGLPAAFTAHDDHQAWTALHGLQGRGRCRPAPKAARDAYIRRFPFVTTLAAALAAADCWELRPDWIRLVNNAQGFGQKLEWKGR